MRQTILKIRISKLTFAQNFAEMSVQATYEENIGGIPIGTQCMTKCLTQSRSILRSAIKIVSGDLCVDRFTTSYVQFMMITEIPWLTITPELSYAWDPMQERRAFVMTFLIPRVLLQLQPSLTPVYVFQVLFQGMLVFYTTRQATNCLHNQY